MTRSRLHARVPRLTWPVLVVLAVGALSVLTLVRHGFGIEPRCATASEGGAMQLAVVHQNAACAQTGPAAGVSSAVVVLAVLALPVLVGYLAGAGLGCWLSIMVRSGLRRGVAGAELIARFVCRLVRPPRMVAERVREARPPRRRRARAHIGASAPGYGTVQSWRGPPRSALAIG